MSPPRAADLPRAAGRCLKRFQVALRDRSYPVVVGDGALDAAGAELARLGFASPPVVISNAKVMKLHGDRLWRSLEATFGPPHVIRIGDGERFKNHDTLMHIYDALFRHRADRSSWILAFGGGIVGDVAGYAAATFMRGIPYVGVPTTLLAQVDSSIGGKTAVNLRQGKNLVGAFHQPSAVISDIGVLRTLPRRELAAGMFEVVKSAAIRSAPLFRYLERHIASCMSCRPSALERIVLECSRIKAEVVSADETEQDVRMVLNYGHTVAHALEAATAYRRFKHGEAVGWGMLAAVGYGRELGLLPSEEADRMVRLIRAIERLPSLSGIEIEDLWRSLARDKKFRSGRIRMVLLPRIGQGIAVSRIDPGHLRRFLADFLLSAQAHKR